MTDQQAVYWASSQVHVWSLQEAPIPALVVSDVCLHLVIHLLVCQEYPFDTCYLGKRVRDGKPCWAKMPNRLGEASAFPAGSLGYKREEEGHAEKCHITCGLQEKLKFISAAFAHSPGFLLPSYPLAFSHLHVSALCFTGPYL